MLIKRLLNKVNLRVLQSWRIMRAALLCSDLH